MSYPLTAYTYIDPSTNNNFPITNSTFVYGTLGPCNWTGLTSGLTKGYTTSSTNYGSLDISSNGLYGNTQLVSLYNYGTDASNIARHTISANQTGIYRLKTTLSFTGLSPISTSDLVFLFTNLDATNTTISPTNFVLIYSNVNISLSSLTTNNILSFGYMYSNTAASGGYITFNTTSIGSGYYNPYYNVYSTASSGVFTNSGICVVDVILYLQQNNPLYFNIQFQNGGTTSYLNATGNFELEMLFAYPTPNYINTLMNYKYNNIPVMNSNLLYNYIAATSWTGGYVAEGTNYGSLGVNTNTSIMYGNTELVNFINYSGNYNTIQVKQSGIYRLVTTLAFSGGNLTTNTIYPIGIAYTTSVCINTTLSSELLLSLNGIPPNYNISTYVSLGYLYSSSSNPTYIFNTSSGNTYPVATIDSKASGLTTFNNNGISVFESILYLSNAQPLYFNISPGSNVYLTTSGNFMLELLSLSNIPSITNTVDISNSALQFSNGYNYIEFYPTTASGTATITFSSNVTLNYLLVGGGGGGSGGSGYDGAGGGGGGSAINGSTSGTTFNIFVGNLGEGGIAGTIGATGGNTSLGITPSTTNIAIAYGGGGGGTYNQISQGGGVWNPVSSPSGNGSKYLAANGGQGTYNTIFETYGSNGYTIDLLFNTYSIGGAGGGSGGKSSYGGAGGNKNIGGSYYGGVASYNGTAGIGYGTGGGAGSSNQSENGYPGGNGGPGLIVLYWQ